MERDAVPTLGPDERANPCTPRCGTKNRLYETWQNAIRVLDVMVRLESGEECYGEPGSNHSTPHGSLLCAFERASSPTNTQGRDILQGKPAHAAVFVNEQ